MRHRIQKTKFGGGKDANDMLMRKMAYNFFTHGSLKTTQTKARVLKSHLERLVEKMKERTEANKNVLKKYLVSEKLIENLYQQVPAVMGNIKGGYVRIEKLQVRISDGAPMARIMWSRPVVIQPEVKEIAPKKVKEPKKEKTVASEKKAKK